MSALSELNTEIKKNLEVKLEQSDRNSEALKTLVKNGGLLSAIGVIFDDVKDCFVAPHLLDLLDLQKPLQRDKRAYCPAENCGKNYTTVYQLIEHFKSRSTIGRSHQSLALICEERSCCKQSVTKIISHERKFHAATFGLYFNELLPLLGIIPPTPGQSDTQNSSSPAQNERASLLSDHPIDS